MITATQSTTTTTMRLSTTTNKYIDSLVRFSWLSTHHRQWNREGSNDENKFGQCQTIDEFFFFFPFFSYFFYQLSTLHTVAQKIVPMFTCLSKISSVWNTDTIHCFKLYVQQTTLSINFGLCDLDKISWSNKLNKMTTYWNNCLSIHFLLINTWYGHLLL